MRRLTTMSALLGALFCASALEAQQPGAGRGAPMRAEADADPMEGSMGGMMAPRSPMGGGQIGDPAAFLLARTGVLKLTDQQVVRLAAIARRTDERRRAMRASMDSMRPDPGAMAPGARPDSAARAQMRSQMAGRMAQMRAAGTRIMEQSHIDRRDAITVLTPDQQAQAWEMMARAPHGMRMGRGMESPGVGGGRWGMMRRSPGGGGRPDVGPRGPGGPGGPGSNGLRQQRRPRPAEGDSTGADRQP